MLDVSILSEPELHGSGRVLAGTAIGAVLGWERERNNRPAGLRTHMAVGLAAALIMVLGDAMLQRYGTAAGANVDPTRVLVAVVTGVAFLGAGTIIVDRNHRSVRGLTTAASLFATAALGVAVGLGMYLLAILSTGMMLLVLVLSRVRE